MSNDNTEMMRKSFMDCIAMQSSWPTAFLVEHGSERYCNLDLEIDERPIAACEVKLHSRAELSEVMKLPIVGFAFGSEARPIVLDTTIF